MNILCTIIATNHTQMQFEAEVELFVDYYLSKIIPSQERDCDIAFAFWPKLEYMICNTDFKTISAIDRFSYFFWFDSQ